MDATEKTAREAIELLEDYRAELDHSRKYLDSDEEKEARRERLSEIGEVIEGLFLLCQTEGNGGEVVREGPPCPECGHPLDLLGEDCEEAEGKMDVEDYYGDGSVFARIGVHHTGVSCPECGFEDADVCVHD